MTTLPGSESAIFVPSDHTGEHDMTAELESFRVRHPGQLVKISDGATVLLRNAFASAVEGDILLDFSNCTIVYDHLTAADYAIACDNTARAGAEAAVSSIGSTTVNRDATVTQITVESSISAKRFDWAAIYSTDQASGVPGGQLGEIFQLLTSEDNLTVTATRQLNWHRHYRKGVRIRALDGSRRLYIKGGRIRARGDVEDTTITDRAGGILVRGFVDPVVEDVTFDHPWSVCLRLQCNAAPRVRGLTVRDVGNLGRYAGYVYGCLLYGMNDHADIRDLTVRNGRHAAFTTGGNRSGTKTWFHLGAPTNALITGVHGYNCHGSVVDTHAEGDNIVFDSVYDFDPYQDEDIVPEFTGLGVQLRCSRPTLRNYFQHGGSRGIKVNAVDHGFEDQVVLQGVSIGHTTATTAPDRDTAVTIEDQSALANKRHVYFDGVISDVGLGFSVGRTSRLTVGGLTARGLHTLMDAGAGSTVVFTAHAELDYRTCSRALPHVGVVCRSDAEHGGSTVVFLEKPKILKGSHSSPGELFTEGDVTTTKKVYTPGIVEFHPGQPAGTSVCASSAATFVPASVTESGPMELPGR